MTSRAVMMYPPLATQNPVPKPVSPSTLSNRLVDEFEALAKLAGRIQGQGVFAFLGGLLVLLGPGQQPITTQSNPCPSWSR